MNVQVDPEMLRKSIEDLLALAFRNRETIASLRRQILALPVELEMERARRQ